MKTKKFNVLSELEKIHDKMNDNGTLFAIYENEEFELSIFEKSKDETSVVCIIAAILAASLTGKGDKGSDRVTHIIVEALKLVQKHSSIASLKLSTELLKGIAEEMELLSDKYDDHDCDYENIENECEDCELMRVCNEKEAIEYRKTHGIPRPKKGKGRKINVN